MADEVCTDCFEESGTNKRKVPRLLKSICLEIPHHKCVKVRVRMKNGVLEPEVRTIPKAHFKGEFVLCDPDRCGRNKQGKTCNYPHCLKEKAAWNAEKFGVVSSRVSPRSALPVTAPAVRDLPPTTSASLDPSLDPSLIQQPTDSYTTGIIHGSSGPGYF